MVAIPPRGIAVVEAEPPTLETNLYPLIGKTPIKAELPNPTTEIDPALVIMVETWLLLVSIWDLKHKINLKIVVQNSEVWYQKYNGTKWNDKTYSILILLERRVTELEEDMKLNKRNYIGLRSTEIESRKAETRNNHNVIKTNSIPSMSVENTLCQSPKIRQLYNL